MSKNISFAKHTHHTDTQRYVKCPYWVYLKEIDPNADRYKSKWERKTAKFFNLCAIRFLYECTELKYFDDKTREIKDLHPDFCIKRAKFGDKIIRNVHIEVLGMDTECYHAANVKKYLEYWKKRVNRHCTVICVVPDDLPNFDAEDLEKAIANCNLTYKLLNYEEDTVNFAPDWIAELDPEN